jgi:pSer/pThr/pTyr-binding forkhead associated (FHA) protein
MKLDEAEPERLPRYRLRFDLREVDLKRGVTCIGRSEHCDISFDDSLVSRRHARIVLKGDAAIIEDLDSRNGVLVNGRRIDRPSMLDPSSHDAIPPDSTPPCRRAPRDSVGSRVHRAPTSSLGIALRRSREVRVLRTRARRSPRAPSRLSIPFQ